MADLEVLCRTSTIHITPEGGSPEPACKASADHRQNPWRPGPKARRRHQPSRPSGREGLREYRKAPPRSRSRPRRRRLNPQSPQGLVHKKSALRDWFYESYGQRTVVSPPRERRPFAPKGRVTSPPAHQPTSPLVHQPTISHLPTQRLWFSGGYNSQAPVVLRESFSHTG